MRTHARQCPRAVLVLSATRTGELPRHSAHKRYPASAHSVRHRTKPSRLVVWLPPLHIKHSSNATRLQVEDEEYQLRPMNCPFHVLAYKQGFYSYRDLPLRWAELGTVYRYERSGTLHGLFRVRGFTQARAPRYLLQSTCRPAWRRSKLRCHWITAHHCVPSVCAVCAGGSSFTSTTSAVS